ncbi:MAG: beta-lactamase family protein [Xanthomonadales bacterium]|nr:beta-lactamase family protein [Xanthomonadales bacterium]
MPVACHRAVPLTGLLLGLCLSAAAWSQEVAAPVAEPAESAASADAGEPMTGPDSDGTSAAPAEGAEASSAPSEAAEADTEATPAAAAAALTDPAVPAPAPVVESVEATPGEPLAEAPDVDAAAAIDADSAVPLATDANATVDPSADPTVVTTPLDGVPGTETLSPPSTSYGLLDKARLDAWLDGLVEASMLGDHLPGVVVSVVEADRLVTARGWGLADVEQRRLADPAVTLFRVGSISKVVTATALMRLQEQGLVDLQQPLSRYLDPLPFAAGEGITLTHLLTHQAGFEDGYLGHFYAMDAASDHAQGPYLAGFPPAQVRPAGVLSSYSNYGYGVIGAVIAEAGGVSFEDYMDGVLGDFGMRHSSFRERAGVPREDDLPDDLAAQLAEGYRWNGWRQQRNDKFWMHRGMASAGSLSSTAQDMARFMRLHLNQGMLDGRPVLQPATIEGMHGVLTRHHDAVGGNAHGFWSRQISGLRTVEHAGAVLNFHSNLVLLPEPRIGIFVSTNGAAGRQFAQDLPRLLIEQFLASRQPAPATPAADLAERAASYVGTYRTTRRNYSKFEASGVLFGGDTEVRYLADEGRLLLVDGDDRKAYRERSPGVFESERDGTTLAFSSIADGPAQRAWPAYGHVVLERVHWYARTELFWAVGGTLLGLSLLRLLGLRLRRPAYGGWVEHSAAAISWLAALGWLAFAVGLFLLLQTLSGPEPDALAHFPDEQAVWVLGIGLVAAVLSLLTTLFLLPVLQRAHWPFWRRLHLLLFVLAALSSLPLLWYWRLLGYHFHGVSSAFLPPGW